MSKRFLARTGLVAMSIAIVMCVGALPRAATAQVEPAAPAYPQQPAPAYSPPAEAQPPAPAYPPQPSPAYPQQPAPAYTPQPAPAYPQQPAPAYPQQPAPAYAPQPTQAYPQQQAYQQLSSAAMPSQPSAIKQMFAGTIATLLSTTGLTLATTLTQGLTGAITGWFARKSGQASAPQAYASAAYPQTSLPAAPAYGSTQSGAQAYPSSPSPAAYPSSSYPSTSSSASTSSYPSGSSSPAYGSTASSSPYGAAPGSSSPYNPPAYAQTASTQVYDTQSGQVSSAAGTAYQPAAGGYDGTLYAGIAYEVLALGANGASTQVNPATYIFHTGDRFMVSYRPSMPGRMEVYNINPAGQQSRIDSVTMAAGQLASLGPYQFSNLTGDESLRLVLAPCSSPQLLVATRDIVNVSANASSTTPVQLGNCGAPTTRGLEVKTRDITKVAVDGGTSFALDPVSHQELSSGQVTAREVNIVFHHR